MSSIEKKMLVVMGFLIVFLVAGVTHLSTLIQDAGGVKAMIIDVGKEIKDISAEIGKHDPE